MAENDARKNQAPHMSCPTCQASGCFEPASVYVVIMETDLECAKLGSTLFGNRPVFSKTQNSASVEGKYDKGNQDCQADVNEFKLILYLCARHDYDLKYLLKGNELEITRRRHLILKEER